MRGNRDDLPTLRVTNISEDTQEQDLRDLFSYVGRVARVYVGRDRETGAGRGFAFVSFEDKATAQRAIERMNGRGYDNLILNVAWSRELLLTIAYVSRCLSPEFHRTSRTALVYGHCHLHCIVIEPRCVDILSPRSAGTESLPSKTLSMLSRDPHLGDGFLTKSFPTETAMLEVGPKEGSKVCYYDWR